MREKNKDKKREIRRMLTGFVQDEGDVVTAADKLFRTGGKTLFNGAASLRFLGLALYRKSYDLEDTDPEQVCESVLASMGRMAGLESAPEETAMIYMPLVANPYMLTAAYEGGRATVSFYSARGLLTFLKARRSFIKFERGVYEETGKTFEEGFETRKERRQKKRKKKNRTETGENE